MAGLKENPMAEALIELALKSLVICKAIVLAGEDASPVAVRPRVEIVRLCARRLLIQVFRLRHAIRVHPDVAETQRQIARQLPLQSDVPLRGLWIAEVDVDVLIEVGGAGSRNRIGGRADVRKLEHRLTS